ARVPVAGRARFAPNAHANGLGEERFLRYRLAEDGVSPMALPGTPGGQYVATGLEHNEAGRPRYDATTHAEMTRKRYAKLERAVEAAPPPHRHGDRSADGGVITSGSTVGAVVEA